MEESSEYKKAMNFEKSPSAESGHQPSSST